MTLSCCPESVGPALAPAVLLGAEGETLFNASYAPMLVVDRSRRIWQVNTAMIQWSGLRQEQLLGIKLGDAVRCDNATRTPWGCGGASGCGNCPLRQAVETCLTQGQVRSGTGAWSQYSDKPEAQRLHARFSVAPLAWPDPHTALVTLEVVSPAPNQALSP
jgi:two-component system, cell cycle sensor histidine kinase and response regulator CckA